MPIRKEFRKFYSGPGWAATRQRILERAENKCEICKKPNRRDVLVTRNGCGGWNQKVLEYESAINAFSASVEWPVAELLLGLSESARRAFERCWYYPLRELPPPKHGRVYKIQCVLTIAHLNHLPGDERDENLKALCQYCHLHHDLQFHMANSRRTRARKVGQLWLSQELEATA